MSSQKSPETFNEFAALLPNASGNDVNGLGESRIRRPSPFFWHPKDKHQFGQLQTEVIGIQRRSPAITVHYSHDAPRGPKAVKKADRIVERSPEEWTATIKEFGLSHEADLVGITPMDPLYVFEGYELDIPWVIVFGVSMDHEELKKVPPSLQRPDSAAEVARQYNRAARVCREVKNHILSQGFNAEAWAGPFASALNMVPAAIQAGIGTLGKHGSLINEEFGSSFRLSAVTTDLPLISDQPKDIGAEEFCVNCQVCVKACPPDAIFSEKQKVRGVDKWFVDFDKCIPYFGEALGCAICLAKCPWSTPGRAPKLMQKMLKRRANI